MMLHEVFTFTISLLVTRRDCGPRSKRDGVHKILYGVIFSHLSIFFLQFMKGSVKTENVKVDACLLQGIHI